MRKYQFYYCRPVDVVAKIIEERMNLSCLTDISSQIKFSGKRNGNVFSLVYKTPYREGMAGSRVSVILDIDLVEKEGGTDINVQMKRSKLNTVASVGIFILVALSGFVAIASDNKIPGIALMLIFSPFFLFNILSSSILYQRVIIGIQNLLVNDANKILQENR